MGQLEISREERERAITFQCAHCVACLLMFVACCQQLILCFCCVPALPSCRLLLMARAACPVFNYSTARVRTDPGWVGQKISKLLIPNSFQIIHSKLLSSGTNSRAVPGPRYQGPLGTEGHAQREHREGAERVLGQKSQKNVNRQLRENGAI